MSINSSGPLPAIRVLDVTGLSKLAQTSLSQNHDVASILLLAHNGSVFASALRPPSSSEPITSLSPNTQFSDYATTRSLRTHAIKCASAWTKYLRDQHPHHMEGSTSSLDQSVTSNPSHNDAQELVGGAGGVGVGESLTFEFPAEPILAIISPVGDKILLAVTGNLPTPPSEPTSNDAQEDEGEDDPSDATSIQENIATSAPSSLPSTTSHTEPPALTNGHHNTPPSGPPHELLHSLQETSRELRDVLSREFMGMKWPSDL